MTDVIIGIDSGTSVVKAIAFTLDGRQIGSFAIRNQWVRVEGGGVEQDPHRSWTDVVAVLKGLAGEVPDLAARTAAVAVTGQGDGTWLVDAAGEPVAPGWLWLDARAGSIVEELRADPDRLRPAYEHTASGLNACGSGVHLLWMKRHAPHLVERAAATLHLKDLLYLRLTGVLATDPSEAIFTFGDFRTRSYSDTVLSVLGLEAEKHLLPQIVDGSITTHPLSADAAAATGLLEGTPVSLGYVDVVCTAMGAGLYDPATDSGVSILGSTAMHMRFAGRAENVRLNDGMTGYTMCIPVPGCYAQMQSSMAATINIDWIADIGVQVLQGAGHEARRADLLARFDALVEAAPPGRLLYHPYVSTAGERGPFVDVAARASLVGISDEVGYGDLVRAVYEGVAGAARDCFTAMGGAPAEVRMSGGAGRSRTLRRILASALGASVRTSTREEAGAAGAAMMALVALGHYPDMDAACAEWVTPTLASTTPPDEGLSRLYADLYGPYVATRQALSPVWRQMKAIRERTDR